MNVSSDALARVRALHARLIPRAVQSLLRSRTRNQSIPQYIASLQQLERQARAAACVDDVRDWVMNLDKPTHLVALHGAFEFVEAVVGEGSNAARIESEASEMSLLIGTLVSARVSITRFATRSEPDPASDTQNNSSPSSGG